MWAGNPIIPKRAVSQHKCFQVPQYILAYRLECLIFMMRVSGAVVVVVNRIILHLGAGCLTLDNTTNLLRIRFGSSVTHSFK